MGEEGECDGGDEPQKRETQDSTRQPLMAMATNTEQSCRRQRSASRQEVPSHLISASKSQGLSLRAVTAEQERCLLIRSISGPQRKNVKMLFLNTRSSISFPIYPPISENLPYSVPLIESASGNALTGRRRGGRFLLIRVCSQVL